MTTGRPRSPSGKESGAAAAANNGYDLDPDAVTALQAAIERLGFTVRAAADASLQVAATTPAGRALAPWPAPSWPPKPTAPGPGSRPAPGTPAGGCSTTPPAPVPNLVHQHHLRQPREGQAGLPPPACQAASLTVIHFALLAFEAGLRTTASARLTRSSGRRPGRLTSGRPPGRPAAGLGGGHGLRAVGRAASPWLATRRKQRPGRGDS